MDRYSWKMKMNKTILAAVFVSVATFGVSGLASASDEFVAACVANSGSAADQGATPEQIEGFCVCLSDEISGDAAAIASLQEAAGDPSKLTPEALAALQTCAGQ